MLLDSRLCRIVYPSVRLTAEPVSSVFACLVNNCTQGSRRTISGRKETFRLSLPLVFEGCQRIPAPLEMFVNKNTQKMAEASSRAAISPKTRPGPSIKGPGQGGRGRPGDGGRGHGRRAGFPRNPPTRTSRCSACCGTWTSSGRGAGAPGRRHGCASGLPPDRTADYISRQELPSEKLGQLIETLS
jgi:hypothetical protein